MTKVCSRVIPQEVQNPISTLTAGFGYFLWFHRMPKHRRAPYPYLMVELIKVKIISDLESISDKTTMGGFVNAVLCNVSGKKFARF